MAAVMRRGDYALAALSLALALALVLLWAAVARAQAPQQGGAAREPFAAAPRDAPVVDYPRFLELTRDGSTVAWVCGERVELRRGDFTVHELRELSLMLRAE